MAEGNRLARGVLCALAGAIAWGFSGAMIQRLFASYSIEPLLMTAIRMLGSGALFLASLAAMRGPLLREMLGDADARKGLAIFGVFGLFACSSLYTTTVFFTNAGTATVLQTLNAPILLAAACLAGRRAPRALELAALVCALVATCLVATGGDPRSLALSPEGLGFGLATAVAAAFYIAYPKRLFERWGSFAVTGVGMAIGGVAALALWLISGGPSRGLPDFDLVGAAVLAVNILIGTFGAFGLYLHGVSIVGSVSGSMLGAAEPVSATLFSALWLGTAFSWADWAGLVLMVATIVLIALQTRRSDVQKGLL